MCTTRLNDSVFIRELSIKRQDLDGNTFSLHRFVSMAAVTNGLPIFAEGALEPIGLRFEKGESYDRHIEYVSTSDSHDFQQRSIPAALRVGKAHSMTCDLDRLAAGNFAATMEYFPPFSLPTR